MKVIWERQESGRRGRLVQYQLIALLVDGHFSESDDNRPVLARLGSIQEQFLRIPVRRTRALAQVALCKVGYESNELAPSDARVSEKGFKNQSWHAEMIYDCHRYITF